jgi:phage shock protein PspC (stress-responsive transcriptional regulator)
VVDTSTTRETNIMETTETIREARRLTRPRDGRWLGGVAAGLGAYFDLSPAIYRVAFVALSLAGGTGILLYIAAWLVIPEEGEQDSIAAVALKRERHRPGRAVGLALLAFVGILVLGEASFWPDPGNVWLAAALAGAAGDSGRPPRSSPARPPRE